MTMDEQKIKQKERPRSERNSKELYSLEELYKNSPPLPNYEPAPQPPEPYSLIDSILDGPDLVLDGDGLIEIKRSGSDSSSISNLISGLKLI